MRKEGSRPQEIANDLEWVVKTGRYTEEKFPSAEVMAQIFHAGHPNMLQAMNILKQRGLVETRRVGRVSGYYIRREQKSS